MKLFKSDGRYLHHTNGYQWIAEFRMTESDKHRAMLAACESLWGDQWLIDKPATENTFVRRKRNPNYIFEYKRKQRRRIYLREESQMMLIGLKADL